jgi:hypothetical protein
MADAAKLQATYDALVEGFVLPLLEGRAGELGRPIAPGCFDFFRQTRVTSSVVDGQIYEALHRAASDIAPLDDVPWPSPGLVAIAAAAHDLLALTDPALDRVFVRGARKTVVEWIDRWIELVPAPTTRGEALARHALVAPLQRVARKDVVVRNWAYTYRFFGRAVPWNVVAMPRLRFVRQEEAVVKLTGLIAQVDARDALGLGTRLRQLIARSPVTELLEVASLPDFRFGLASLAVLSDRAIAGGIAKRLVAEDEWKVCSVLGRAVAAPELRAEPALLSVAVRFLVEMMMTSTFDGGEKRRETPDVLDEGAARYAAMLVALLSHEGALEELRILDDGDRAALQRRAEKLRAAVVPERIGEGVHLLDLAFGRGPS